jgi:asparagine synthase (glutamine-hydrolysing)
VGAHTRAIFEQYQGNDFVNHRMFVDAHTYLPDQILALTDRMSMAVSLEARTPFLDYRLVEFASGLSGDCKAQGSSFKIILKEALGDLVPNEIVNRPKWGFAAPVRTWMGSKHLDVFTSLLRNSKLAAEGFLDKRVLQEFLNHPATRDYNSEWLWAMAVLELWFRIYCVGDGLSCPQAGLEEYAEGFR